MGGEDKIAWDIYLFYAPGATWEAELPVPLDWVHQLGEAAWADPARYHRGADLLAALQELLHRGSLMPPPKESGDKEVMQ